MRFQGQVPSVRSMLADGVDESCPSVVAETVPVRTAASNAVVVGRLLAAGDSDDEGWRFGVLQTVDDYQSCMRRGGVGLARQVFAAEPPTTGSVRLDAAFAALAEHLARTDGWECPGWALDPARRVAGVWYPCVPRIFRAEADAESPEAFRVRGIMITGSSLARA